MNIALKSRSARVVLVTAAVLALARAGTAFAASSIDDELLREVHEFQLANGESKLIANHKHPERMEVCVTQGKGAVPVDVNYDGVDRMVKAGACDEFTAKKVRLSPGAKIGEGEMLLGKYKFVKANAKTNPKTTG
jgi:hypothetical protein